jgi:hypothetical protein
VNLLEPSDDHDLNVTTERLQLIGRRTERYVDPTKCSLPSGPPPELESTTLCLPFALSQAQPTPKSRASNLSGSRG